MNEVTPAIESDRKSNRGKTTIERVRFEVGWKNSGGWPSVLGELYSNLVKIGESAHSKISKLGIFIVFPW